MANPPIFVENSPERAPAAADADAKEARLVEWMRSRRSVLVGYSGGVDSTYLACVAVEALGPEHVLAVIGRSPSYPIEQWATARSVAERMALPVMELDTAELEDPRYAANSPARCYFCKTELWGRLGALARARGLSVVIDGTNADDLADHRPGVAAAREHGVESPLALIGFSKRDIRERSRARGLPTWAQPSSPCLSSRIPYGSPVTADRLRRIEAAERALRELGIDGDLRVRDHGDLARIEIAPDVLAHWLSPATAARAARAVQAAGFARVAIDLAGFRSGSLNVLAGVRGE